MCSPASGTPSDGPVRAGTNLFGFAEHNVSTTYLGSSTGLRLRYVQPTGKLEVVARTDGGTRSAWVGAGSADLATVHVEELEERLMRRLAWGERTARARRRVATRS